jgi:hypothetical protein
VAVIAQIGELVVGSQLETSMKYARITRLGLLSLMLASGSVFAETVLYNNDVPDGRIGVASGGPAGNETADDFFAGGPTTLITGGSFTGLIPKGATVTGVGVEIYRVEPEHAIRDVPTRFNSPSDDGIPLTERLSGGGGLSFTTSLLSNGAGVSNSVLTGIHSNSSGLTQMTGGEGGISGQEVRFNFTTDAISLPAGHYFFVPTVDVTGGSAGGNLKEHFAWLSASRPISGLGSTPINPDLQAWTRNGDLHPDWLRVGTDIIGPTEDPATYNMAFRLTGTVVPEPTPIAMLLVGLVAVAAWSQRKRAQAI